MEIYLREIRIMAICPRWMGVWGLMLATLLNSRSVDAQDKPGESIRAVRDVLERQVADWNRGNLDAFLEGYWNSPKVVFQSGGNRFDGWDALRQRYRRRYQDEGPRDGSPRIHWPRDRATWRGGIARAWTLSADDARRHKAVGTVHRDLPQVSRGLEDRSRPHIRRGASPTEGRAHETVRLKSQDGRDGFVSKPVSA